MLPNERYKVLTVKYPSEVRWASNTDGHASGAEREGDGEGEGCEADVIVFATNRLAGTGDEGKVNFTFEVRIKGGGRKEGGREGWRRVPGRDHVVFLIPGFLMFESF